MEDKRAKAVYFEHIKRQVETEDPEAVAYLFLKR